MKRLWLPLVNLYLIVVPGLAFAGGGGLKAPEAIEKKIPLEGLSGINLLFSRAYNDNLWLYALYCVVLMGGVGMVIALGTDVILKAIGMEVHKIEHKE